MTGDATRLGRRQVLAGAGAAVLASVAGCNGRVFEDSPPTIAAEDLAAATDGDLPTVPRTLPVAIESSFVAGERDIARSDLDATPVPFDEAEIPNGVIRQRLNDTHDGALRAIRDASEAPSAYERLEHAARARTDAHEVRAAWAAIRGDLDVASLRQSITGAEEDVGTLVSTHAYVGDDPVRAAVVHDEIEGRIRGARRWLSVPDRAFAAAAESVLDAAGIAADIERARTEASGGAYLFDRFRGSLDAATDQRDRLVDARAALRNRIGEQTDSVPEERPDDPASLVDRDIGTTAGVWALERLASETRARVEQLRIDRDAPGLASGVVSAVPILTHARAFETLRDRIEGGDDLAVGTVGDVAGFRSDAIAAVEAAGDVGRGGPLADAFRPTFAREIEQADYRFDGGPEEVQVDSVARDAEAYVRVAALCAVLPAAAGTVADALDGTG